MRNLFIFTHWVISKLVNQVTLPKLSTSTQMSSGTWLKIFNFAPVRLPAPFNVSSSFQVTFLIWVLDQLWLAKLVPSQNMISNP